MTLDTRSLRSLDERVVCQLAQAYVEQYPGTSFRFRFDDRADTTIGEAVSAAAVRFAESQRTWREIFSGGSIPLGEAYCDGRINADYPALAAFAEFLLRVTEERTLLKYVSLPARLRIGAAIAASTLTTVSRNHAADVNAHYSMDLFNLQADQSNRIFQLFLGPTLSYTCADWSGAATTLEEAQRAKFARYAELLALRPGMKLLDLGCGWGEQSLSYARQFGTVVHLVTLSRAQAAWIRQRRAELGIEERVHIHEMDMFQIHKLPECFDAAVAIGSLEHADGQFDRLFAAMKARLRPEAPIILHTMLGTRPFDAWLGRYMWPGVQIPSRDHLEQEAGRHFTLRSIEEYPAGAYARTFQAWAGRFAAHEVTIRAILSQRSTPERVDRFARAMQWYLACCTAIFRSYYSVGFAYCTAR